MSLTKIQGLILNNRKGTKDLYYKGKKCLDTDVETNGIRVQSTGTLTFDTYFNAFSIKKWKKYTKLKNLKLEVECQGKYKITNRRLKKEKLFRLFIMIMTETNI